MASKGEEVKKAMRVKKEVTSLSNKDYLSTGSTLLNLELSGRPKGGLVRGKYYLFVGDSGAGKSWLGLTCLAEAGINKSFQDYRFIYNNPEDGALMDMARYFGTAVSGRIEERASATVEEFYYDLDDIVKGGKPFIYLLDSMDALITEDDEEHFDKRKKAFQNGKKEVAGSYGTAKAKANSRGLSTLMSPLKKSGSILIIISQTRDNIGFGSQYNPKTRSGGKSLRFYATSELWFSIKEKIHKSVRGKQRHVGTLVKIQVKKNRQAGREPSVEIPIYHSSGLDDVGSMVDYLVDEGHWKEGKGKGIEAPDFEFSGKKEDLIRQICDGGLEPKLISTVCDLWREVQAESAVPRKNRYGQA